MLIRKSDKAATYLYNIKEDPDHTKNIAEDNPDKVEELWSLALKDADGDIPVLDVSFPMLDRKQEESK